MKALPLLQEAKRRATPEELAKVDAAIALRVLRPFLSKYEPHKHHAARDAAWIALAAIMQRIIADPDIIITGINLARPNDKIMLQPHLLRRIRDIDWIDGAIIIAGHTGIPPTRYENLMAEARTLAPPADTPEVRRAPRRKAWGLDYREADAVLVAELQHGLQAGRWRSQWDGGHELAHRAQGKGSLESKAKRLVRRLRDLSQG